eukprot:CAMPEP_0175145466 /NCGR_PEP_ID=MMETSP0087-20121206/14787_1 /TAXON_ID=136419 /ORGANISM="Unknown Unknown, Strain D1" /LENGTH=360 /DNA_ID=CAMNT_0016430217 /DNA_START=234 /DNA_END=1317 /DNA_ORIENTATION=-
MLYDGQPAPQDNDQMNDRCLKCRKGQQWPSGELPHQTAQRRREEEEAATLREALELIQINSSSTAPTAPMEADEKQTSGKFDQEMSKKLCLAIENGAVEEAKKCLKEGADPNYIHLATTERSTAPYQPIKPGDTSYAGYTALAIAASRADVIMVALLLIQPSINVNKTTRDGYAPIYLAVTNSHKTINVVKILLQRPELNPKPPNVPFDASLLAYAAQQYSTEVVQELLSNPKVVVDEQALSGALSAYNENFRTVMLLMAHGGHQYYKNLLKRYKSSKTWQNKALKGGIEARKLVEGWMARHKGSTVTEAVEGVQRETPEAWSSLCAKTGSSGIRGGDRSAGDPASPVALTTLERPPCAF